jgi:hypothetical protein
MSEPRGTWSFTFRLPDGTLPSVGGKPSELYDNTIYVTKAQGTSRKEAEKQARATVAKRGKVALRKLKLSGSSQVDYNAVEIDGKLD